MISISKEIVERHTDAEIIEFLYKSLSKIYDSLDDAAGNQNLIAIGSALPNIGVCVAVLKELKTRNDERSVLK